MGNRTAVFSATWRVLKRTNEVTFMKISWKLQKVMSSHWEAQQCRCDGNTEFQERNWVGRQAGLGTQVELGRGLGSGGEGGKQTRLGAGGSGMRMWTLPPDHLPRGQQPTYAVFFPRLYAENMKTKSSTLITEVKRLSHLNPEMPTLGLTPPTPQPQDAGFKTNFISSI